MLPAFHLAFHVPDLTAAKEFYCETLGCSLGRETDGWVDFNFFGHQLSLHLGEATPPACSSSDGERSVPMPHFGVILDSKSWQKLADRLTAAQADFIVAPTTRFKGRPGEQHTLFFRDPFGYALEIKGFADMADIFNT